MSELVRLDAPAVPARLPDRLDTIEHLAAGWLMRFGPNTRDAYGRDLRRWLEWCASIGVDPLAAGIHHADSYSRLLLEVPDPRTGRPLAPSSVSRRLSALSSFYRYAKRHHGAVAESPFADAARPRVSDDSPTTGLTRDELRRLVATAQADGPRSAALIALLAYNGVYATGKPTLAVVARPYPGFLHELSIDPGIGPGGVVLRGGAGAVHARTSGGPASGPEPDRREGALASPKGLKARPVVCHRQGPARGPCRRTAIPLGFR
jgi:integrase family protein with SAM-like domain